MMDKIKEIMNTYDSLLRQMILYGLIGGGSALLDTCCYVALTRAFLLGKFTANFISVNIGIGSSFLLNAFFNFKKADKLGKRALSFFAVGYGGLLLSLLLLYVGTDLLGFNDILVKFSSIFIVAGLQFCLNKLITFSKI